jgi:hypothetical protein
MTKADLSFDIGHSIFDILRFAFNLLATWIKL